MTRLTYAVLLLSVGSILFASACNNDPGATATPTALDQLKASGEVMRQEKAFHFDLKYDGQRGTPILNDWELVSASGDISSGDAQMTAGIRVPQLNAFVAEKVIMKGGDTFLSDPITGKWAKAPSDQIPCALNNMNERVADLAQQAQSAVSKGDDTVNGQASYHLQAVFPAQSFAAMVCSGAQTGTVQSDVWVDKQTRRIVKVRLEGKIDPSEPDGLVRTLTFSQFGQTVDIQAPSL